MVQDGVITRNEDFIINLKAELRKRDIRTESLVFTVASSRIANREARIPLCKPKQILPLITANAADYFPVDMNQYHLVYNILGKTEEEAKAALEEKKAQEALQQQMEEELEKQKKATLKENDAGLLVSLDMKKHVKHESVIAEKSSMDYVDYIEEIKR
jgi:hypothetical protein